MDPSTPSAEIGSPSQEKSQSTLRVTREGWYWLTACVILLITGVVKSINLITLIAYVMTVLFAVNFFLAGRRLHLLKLKRWMEGPLFAQRPFGIEIEVSNPGRWKQIGIRIESLGRSHQLGWFIASLDPGRSIRFHQEISIPHRGKYRGEVLRVCSAFPFGLVERNRTLPVIEEEVVLTSLGRLYRERLRRFLAQASSMGRARRRPRRHPTAQSEFHGLREFRNGDSLRWIHWRTSARRGELMVREYEEAPNDNLIVILDPWVAPRSEPEEYRRTYAALDEAVSLASTVCWEWCRQTGARLLLAIGGSDPVVMEGQTSLEHGVRVLQHLAIQEGSSDTDLALLLDRLFDVKMPPAPILLVSTRPDGLGEALSLHLHRPVSVVDISNKESYDFYEYRRTRQSDAARQAVAS